jgi:hypothetical protein
MPSLAPAVRPAAIVGLLLAAVVGTTLVSMARQDKQEMLTTERLPWHTEDPRPRFLMDREGWVRTPDEHVVEVAYDLKNGPNIARLPFQFSNWVGRDADVANEESLPTLGADNFLHRQYWRPGDSSALWLTVISGTKGQSFHAPTVCYVAANWSVEERPPQYIPVANGQLGAHAILARLDTGERFVDMHWYLWTDVRREWRLGATLMRVTIPVTTSEEDALTMGADFAQNFFTRVLG